MVEVPAHRCPQCASDDVERVRRDRTLDRLASLLGWRVYRCITCGTRFYDRPVHRRAYRAS
jgi:predicted Zn-ribbon and HTH transcriptional regulator